MSGKHSEIPDGWETMTLKDACSLNPKHPKETRDDLDVTFAPMPAVDASVGELDPSEVRKFSDVRRGYTHFEEGDVLFAKITPCMQNGKCAIALGLVNGKGCGSTEFFVLRPGQRISSKYLHYFLRQEGFRQDAAAAMTGVVGQARVPKDWLLAQTIPVAPPDQQKRIVAKLDALFEHSHRAKDALDQIPDLVEKYRQSVLAAACSGKLTEEWRKKNPDVEPAENLLARIRVERQGILDELARNGDGEAKRTIAKLRKRSPGTLLSASLPKSWTSTSLRDLCLLVVDCHNKTAPYQDSGIPLVRTSNIRNGTLLFDGVKYISDETYNYWSRRCPPKSGDILFTREAPMGQAAIVPQGTTVCMGQRLMLLRTIPQYTNREYLLSALQEPFFRQRMRRKAVGTTAKHLRVGDVEDLLIPVPPIEEQNEICRILTGSFERLDHAVGAVASGQKNLEAATWSLLEAAFSGRLTADAK